MMSRKSRCCKCIMSDKEELQSRVWTFKNEMGKYSRFV